MVQNSNWRELDTIYELKNIHSHQHLRDNDQNISQSDRRAWREWGLKPSFAECHTDERVCGEDQDKDLCEAGDVMVDKTATIQLTHVCEGSSIRPLNEKSFQDIVADQEGDNQCDGDDEG